jgi:hypothetical protein
VFRELKRIEEVVVTSCRVRSNVGDHVHHGTVVSQVVYQGPLVEISTRLTISTSNFQH